jgi:hypothetical protein
MLKKFGDAEEQGGRFLRIEVLPDVEKVDNARKQCSTSSWTDWRFVEDAGFLDDGGLVIVVRADADLLLFLGEVKRGEGRHRSDEKSKARIDLPSSNV